MREVLPLFLLELMNEDPKVCGRQESRRILIGNYVRKHHACFLFPGPPRGEWSLVFSSGSAAWRMVSGGFFFPGPPRGEWSLVFFSGSAAWRMVPGRCVHPLLIRLLCHDYHCVEAQRVVRNWVAILLSVTSKVLLGMPSRRTLWLR